MKGVLFVLCILAAMTSINTSAAAQSYPWCAYYSNGFSGENCGFVSFEQCMATLSGMGGNCARNTQYVPSAGPLYGYVGQAPRHRPRHKRSPYS